MIAQVAKDLLISCLQLEIVVPQNYCLVVIGDGGVVQERVETLASCQRKDDGSVLGFHFRVERAFAEKADKAGVGKFDDCG